MQKIVNLFLGSLLFYWIANPISTPATGRSLPTHIIDPSTFVNIIRDLELLNSWSRNLDYDYDEEWIAKLEYANRDKILHFYSLDQENFTKSVDFYLNNSSQKALEVYKKVYLALQELSTN